MLCDICKKNEATIHIKEISDGKRTRTVNMCEECAAKQKGQLPPFNSLGLGELLYNLQNGIKAAAEKFASGGNEQEKGSAGEHVHNNEPEKNPDNPELSLTCPVCHWNYEKIRRDGRLGCEECYHTFRELIESAIRSVQRGERHIGKHPANLPPPDNAEEIRRYREELSNAVAEENYERAAELRDLLKKLVPANHKTGSGEAKK